jgi:hypothetical protein
MKALSKLIKLIIAGAVIYSLAFSADDTERRRDRGNLFEFVEPELFFLQLV